MMPRAAALPKEMEDGAVVAENRTGEGENRKTRRREGQEVGRQQVERGVGLNDGAGDSLGMGADSLGMGGDSLGGAGDSLGAREDPLSLARDL